jgi:CheY-like chemotaxis protein
VDDKQLGFSLGAAEYIVKPLEKKILLRKLKNLEKIARIKNILVVDNDAATAELISTVFGKAGYPVTTADTSEDAIRLIGKSAPDLIVLNLAMPQERGFDIIEYIKTDKEVKDIPLIVVANKDFTREEAQQLNGRIQGILKKGLLDEETLLRELKNTIGRLPREL